MFNLAVPGNIYTRIMNPTADVLEKRVAELDSGIAGLALSAGSAAINYSILTIAEKGSNVVSVPMLYGGTYTLLRNSNDFSKDEPYAGVHGSALRAVYDFADLEKSQFIISTGQSGNVMSPHYDDLAEKWAKLEYVPMVTRLEDYGRSVSGRFILKPGP